MSNQSYFEHERQVVVMTPYRFLLHLSLTGNLLSLFFRLLRALENAVTNRLGNGAFDRAKAAMDGNCWGLSHALGPGEGWV